MVLKLFDVLNKMFWSDFTNVGELRHQGEVMFLGQKIDKIVLTRDERVSTGLWVCSCKVSIVKFIYGITARSIDIKN